VAGAGTARLPGSERGWEPERGWGSGRSWGSERGWWNRPRLEDTRYGEAAFLDSRYVSTVIASFSTVTAVFLDRHRGGSGMARYVITPDVALRLAGDRVAVPAGHHLLAPTLLRSQLLSLLYQAVRRGELTRKEADRQLDYVRGLRLRLLGDRVLQGLAWRFADQLGWPDTLTAEYVALAKLQADALVTLDATLARQAAKLVPTAPVDVLL
jgi:predicted nucleic acid-binding protein